MRVSICTGCSARLAPAGAAPASRPMLCEQARFGSLGGHGLVGRSGSAACAKIPLSIFEKSSRKERGLPAPGKVRSFSPSASPLVGDADGVRDMGVGTAGHTARTAESGVRTRSPSRRGSGEPRRAGPRGVAVGLSRGVVSRGDRGYQLSTSTAQVRDNSICQDSRARPRAVPTVLCGLCLWMNWKSARDTWLAKCQSRVAHSHTDGQYCRNPSRSGRPLNLCLLVHCCIVDMHIERDFTCPRRPVRARRRPSGPALATWPSSCSRKPPCLPRSSCRRV